MNRKITLFFVFASCLFGGGAAQESLELNIDALLSLEIQQALAREDQAVSLSVESQVVIVSKDIQKAKSAALSQAFLRIVNLAVKQMILPERFEEVQKAIEGLIYRQARLFIQQYQLGNSKVQEQKTTVDGKEELQKIYILPVKITLNLKMLHTSLLENKILTVDYVIKEIRFHGFKKYADAQFMRNALEKRIQNLKRLTETYQTKDKIYFLVETSSSLQEIMERLNIVRGQEGAPLFKVKKDEEMGGLDITFVP